MGSDLARAAARPRAPAPHRHVLREPPHRGRHVLGLARGDLYRPAHAPQRHLRQCRRALHEEPRSQAADRRQDPAQARLLHRLQGQVAPERRHGDGEPCRRHQGAVRNDDGSRLRLLRLHRHRRLHRRRAGRLSVRPDHLGPGRPMAEGQGPADDRPAPALVSRGQSRQPARRDVAQHRPARPAGPGQGRQAQDRRRAGRQLYKQEWNGIPLQKTWQQPLDAPGRIPAHRIYHRGQRLPDRADPQRGMARPHAPELLFQLPSATSTSRSSRSSISSTGSGSPTRPS